MLGQELVPGDTFGVEGRAARGAPNPRAGGALLRGDGAWGYGHNMGMGGTVWGWGHTMGMGKGGGPMNMLKGGGCMVCAWRVCRCTVQE